jgi:hypothetical protein
MKLNTIEKYISLKMNKFEIKSDYGKNRIYSN